MNQITVPLPLFRRYLGDVVRRPDHPLRCPAGVSRWEGGVEIIAASGRPDTGHTLLLAHTGRFLPPDPLPPDCVGALVLGYAGRRGHAVGFAQAAPGRLEPVQRLRLVGAEMHTIALDGPGHDAADLLAPGPGAGLSPLERERWSRTIGALGADVWQRLTGLRCALVGVGRTGIALATALARLGVRHLTLIDPDRVERHNLGEMQGITAIDIGRLKVEAAAASLGAFAGPRLTVRPVPHSITRLDGLRAAQSCDALFCCGDHDSARLATTAIAVLFCKPLLDAATGIHGQGAEQIMGADVRLLLPGRCLLCFGGVRDEAEARRALASADAERALFAGRDWRQERAGSLYSLNQLAAALALQLWQGLVAGHVSESTWAHAEFASGRLALQYPEPEVPAGTCRLCALSGWGEAGLPLVVEWLRETPQIA